MGMANIDSLLAKKAQLVEAIRIRTASINNINPNYKDNQAYLAKLKAEVATLNADLASVNAQLAIADAPVKIPTATKKPAVSKPKKQVEVTTPTPTEPEVVTSPDPTPTTQGLSGAVENTRAQATQQDNVNLDLTKDWRVRLSLAPDSGGVKYLYNMDNPGILEPLKYTNGVIFPYTPTIAVSYIANYNADEVTHSNYKIVQYKSSAVDTINITCQFTAQDTSEANYMLAVIHFFKSVTKMFYGQDENPKNGTPPPLCYLSGYGDYQFNAHPLVVTNFTYNLPNDVDYIRANVKANSPAGTSQAAANYENGSMSRAMRLTGNLLPGGNASPPKFADLSDRGGTRTPTYVPTKLQMTISCLPIVSRYDISNNFSLAKYATGELLLGNKRENGGYGGFW